MQGTGISSLPSPLGRGAGVRDGEGRGEGGVGEGADDPGWHADLNPDSVKIVGAFLEPALKDVKPEERFQFERHGYFVADLRDSKPGAPVFNRAVTLRDSWARDGR